MNARVFKKSKLPSRDVTKGASRLLRRAYRYLMLLRRAHIRQRQAGSEIDVIKRTVTSIWGMQTPLNAEKIGNCAKPISVVARYREMRRRLAVLLTGAATHSGALEETYAYADI